jgi:hypothetical protein
MRSFGGPSDALADGDPECQGDPEPHGHDDQQQFDHAAWPSMSDSTETPSSAAARAHQSDSDGCAIPRSMRQRVDVCTPMAAAKDRGVMPAAAMAE